MSTKKLRVVISGSFRRHFDGISEAVRTFESLGVSVLSPKESKVVNPGEEFAILLDINEPPEKVRRFIEQMREAVHALAITHEGSPLGVVSISMGLVILKGLSATRSPAELYSQADTLLYKAKQAGRNQLVSQTLD